MVDRVLNLPGRSPKIDHLSFPFSTFREKSWPFSENLLHQKRFSSEFCQIFKAATLCNAYEKLLLYNAVQIDPDRRCRTDRLMYRTEGY